MRDPVRDAEAVGSICWEDRTIVAAARLARRFAAVELSASAADDVSQDVALYLAERINSGRLAAPPIHLHALVRRMVAQRIIDRARRERRREEREADYGREVAASAHTWMHPDLALTERELETFHAETLDTLPAACREVFVLVRQGTSTYKMVGGQMGITPLAVCAHVVTAQHAFRARLSEQDIVVPRRHRARRRVAEAVR